MKVRIRFSKQGKIRWTSQRDVARIWERALRRARLPLAYTAGFSPRPVLSFGLALPTGCESSAEYLDVTTSEPVCVEGLPDLLNGLLPEGIEVQMAAALDGPEASLQQEVSSCSWRIEVPDIPPEVLAGAVNKALQAQSLPVERERKGRKEIDDLRSSVLALSSERPTGPGALLVAELATHPRGVRPSELACAIGVRFGKASRTNQWIEREGLRTEPLHVPTRAASTEERAS